NTMMYGASTDSLSAAELTIGNHPISVRLSGVNLTTTVQVYSALNTDVTRDVVQSTDAVTGVKDVRTGVPAASESAIQVATDARVGGPATITCTINDTLGDSVENLSTVTLIVGSVSTDMGWVSADSLYSTEYTFTEDGDVTIGVSIDGVSFLTGTVQVDKSLFSRILKYSCIGFVCLVFSVSCVNRFCCKDPPKQEDTLIDSAVSEIPEADAEGPKVTEVCQGEDIPSQQTSSMAPTLPGAADMHDGNDDVLVSVVVSPLPDTSEASLKEM
ncbi:hypothetical protein KIPB_006909, partial [Kipferlia bialata]